MLAAITSAVAGALLLAAPAAYAAPLDLGTASDPAPKAAETAVGETAGIAKEVSSPLQDALEALTQTEDVSNHVGEGLDGNVEDLLDQLGELVPDLH
jgi:hypothetical protein